jgi:hypothetical protein
MGRPRTNPQTVAVPPEVINTDSFEYSEELAGILCALISQGNSLKTIGAMQGMPCARTVFIWLHSKPDFREAYDQAQKQRTYAIAEECFEIADDPSNWQTKELVQAARMRIDTRKWFLARMDPRRYGDKVALTDPNGGAPTFNVVIRSVLDPKPTA